MFSISRPNECHCIPIATEGGDDRLRRRSQLEVPSPFHSAQRASAERSQNENFGRSIPECWRQVRRPTDDDVRALVALQMMAQRELPGFDAWLRNRKPLFNTSVFKAAGLCPPPFLAAPPPPALGNDKLRATDPTPDELPLRPPLPSAHTDGSRHGAKPSAIETLEVHSPARSDHRLPPARNQPSVEAG